ncbi:GntR family transcriptional regulator, partial [Erysipelothrix rhusiopathiae]|nr:GntR family transcriptional regulator [Erysipelothrix rhusiopathiae]
MTKPLYEKIKNDIQRDIMNGTLSVNSQLPTELELSTTYGVSRITSKRALNELEQDGLIYRVQGKGSFVAETNTKKTSEDVFDLLFMMPFPDASNFGDYTSGMLQALQGTPYRLHIQRYDLETQYDDYAGVIFYPIDNHDALEAVFTLYARNIPVVILDKEVSGMPITTVVSNNDQGGYEATKHLMEQGV